MIDKRTVDISTGIIFRTILIILGLWFLYLIRDIIAIFFIALIMTAAIEPSIKWLTRRKIPRSFSVLIIFLVLFLILGLVVSFLIPPLVGQFKSFTQNLPAHLDKFTQTFGGVEIYFKSYGIEFSSRSFLANLGDNLSQSGGKVFSTTVGFFTGIITMIAIMSMTFYLSVKEEGMDKILGSVTPAEHRVYVVSLAERIKEKIGKWLQGQLLLMLIIFILDFIALYFLGIPYALILAIFAGILEIIPYLGPIISAVPGVILGFLVSPLTGLLALAAYVVVQQFENHIIVPQVMKKTIGLNPVVVILALLIGAKLGGILGAILAVPLAAAISVFVGDLIQKNEKQNVSS
jgi:predicted PurR-regulated permease PerM